MNCPYCGSPLAPGQNRCVHCGTDVSAYRSIKNSSVICYNAGLERAGVRDLTGAMEWLEKSLRYDKYNTEARNLLGLVHFERNEIVAALKEWIISKNLQDKDNPAEDYMEELQAHPGFLNETDQSIKKYNAALEALDQGNQDLAVIQLRKVFAGNPRYVRAGQLLTLLYMEEREFDKAGKCLKKLLRIDVGDPVTLRYQKELETLRQEIEPGEEDEPKVIDDAVPMKNPGKYKEDKPSAFLFWNLIIGIIIGLGVFGILIMPTIRSRSTQEANNTIASLSQEIATKETSISDMTKEKENLEKEMAKLQESLDLYEKDGQEAVTATESLDALLDAGGMYLAGESNLAIATKLADVSQEQLSTDTAKTLYEELYKKTVTEATASLYQKAVEEQYNAGDFRAAIKTLEQILEIDPEHTNAMFYLGRSYERLGETDTAKNYYTKLTEDYGDSDGAKEAAKRLQELN